MLFLEDLFGRGIFRNLTVAVPVALGISDHAVEAEVSGLEERQEALRIALVDTEPVVQRLGETDPRVDVRTTEPSEPIESLVTERQRELLRAPQQRTTPGRARYELVRSADGRERRLLVTFDHLVADGSSEEIVRDELSPRLTGTGALPKAPGLRFRALCEQRSRAAADGGREIKYWRKTLGGVEPLRGLTPRPAPAGDPTLSQVENRIQGPALHRRLVEWRTAQGVTPFVLVASLTAAAIWRRTGQRAFALFTPMSSRQPPAFNGTIGCFAHDRPLACHVDPAQSLSGHVRATMSRNWLGPRFAALSMSDLASEVPALADALLTPGVDYVQLHVGVRPERVPAQQLSPAAQRVPLDLGPFRPTHDLTVTTLRFRFSPAGTMARAFFGGPDGGLVRAEGLTGDVLSLLTAAPGAGDDTLGSFVERVLG
jgi:hypothetical protein